MFFCVLGEYKKITSYLLDGCVPGCGEAGGRRRRQGGRDLTWVRGEVEPTRVSTRRDGENSLVTEGVNRPPNSTNRTQKTILNPTKPNVHIPLKTVLNNQKINRKTTGHSSTTDKCIIILTLFFKDY